MSLNLWLPIVVVCAIVTLSLFFSIVFAKVFQDKHDSEGSVTLVAVTMLSIILITTTFIPIDVYLVSSSVNSSSGHKYEWATKEFISNFQNILEYVYYSAYGLLTFFAFVLAPFFYFYFEEWDSEDQDNSTRRLNAFRYTLITIFILAILILAGYFISVGEKPQLEFDWFKNIVIENGGQKIMSFLIAVMASAGVLVYVFYTSIGLASLPMSIIRAKKNPEILNIWGAQCQGEKGCVWKSWKNRKG
ncbi:hypothetical protein ROZALSC1DRAFT_29552 [Rozella allomycis CSF55]|uniref:Probable lysosomal cobalamin transporter n=1 Tax=Rozella allomycis (strain CSF55) TaxID=988480 RepID=A0A4P9YHE2_ROZAC|nr:hypothetical protein ROZALSC1DRAFT_29552 [Rozella allomycis CSF55]